ncbi:prolactin-releasing peptide [Solea senegalensis]|uniref:Prolactin-releasing peptide n=1 Tax=Solea senegalensis TaxID=28829 RepID=A0AAV6T5P2_SOLSE|nr:prolactin-releasing peptide [Solea senegalensis]
MHPVVWDHLCVTDVLDSSFTNLTGSARIYKLVHTCSTVTTPDLHQLTSACYQSSGALFDSTVCCLGERLMSSTAFSSAHSTTVEHDFHIVHNVDNRSPEIDPFWYVGRGVRPIGRFGKRHSSVGALGNGEMHPVVRTLELLLNSLKNKQKLEKVLNGEDRDWLP